MLALFRNPGFYILLAAFFILAVVFIFMLRSADKKLQDIKKAKYRRRKP